MGECESSVHPSSPEMTDLQLCPWESLCRVVNVVYKFAICIFAQLEFFVHNTFVRGRGKLHYFKISQRHEDSLILSRVPGLEILGYRLAKTFIQNFLLMNIFANPILFSDPVFWTKPQEPHLRWESLLRGQVCHSITNATTCHTSHFINGVVKWQQRW